MDPATLQLIQITVSGIAIVLGPVTAVCITLWYQSRKSKIDSKKALFLTLMAHRKVMPPYGINLRNPTRQFRQFLLRVDEIRIGK